MDDPWALYRSGSTEPWTVELLCALVRAKRPHVLIETGTFEGLTTRELFRAMEYFAPDHVSVLFSLEYEHERWLRASAYLASFSTPPNGPGIQLIETDALAWLRQRPAGFADFIFLDDDHTQAHVEAELVECERILRPGGIICGHDVIGPFCLGELFTRRGGIVLDLPRLHAAGGLGVITR